MPTDYTDQFFTFDPANPPPAGTAVSFVLYTLTDQDDDGDIDAGGTTAAVRDRVNGSFVTASYPGDTVTIDVPGVGLVTYTGTTFYLQNGQQVFTPTDGQVLQNGTFVESTFVTGQGPLVVPGDLGPSCFTPGTLILTPNGERAVETLRPGDLVMTRDHGAQAVQWAGSETVAGIADLAPVLIRADVFGNRRDLLVSPQHRMVVRGWRAELFAGQPEVMVAAVHLVNGRTAVRAPCASITYIHFMLARHEIVFAEGAETESLDPAGDVARANDEIRRLFPALARMHGQSRARPAVPAWEGRAMAI